MDKNRLKYALGGMGGYFVVLMVILICSYFLPAQAFRLSSNHFLDYIYSNADFIRDVLGFLWSPSMLLVVPLCGLLLYLPNSSLSVPFIVGLTLMLNYIPVGNLSLALTVQWLPSLFIYLLRWRTKLDRPELLNGFFLGFLGCCIASCGIFIQSLHILPFFTLINLFIPGSIVFVCVYYSRNQYRLNRSITK